MTCLMALQMNLIKKAQQHGTGSMLMIIVSPRLSTDQVKMIG